MSQERDSTDATAVTETAAPPFRRQSATGAEQERRKAWGREHGAKVKQAVSEAFKGA